MTFINIHIVDKSQTNKVLNKKTQTTLKVIIL